MLYIEYLFQTIYDLDFQSWIRGLNGLEEWEKNLEFGEASLNTSAKSELARARFILGLISLHNFWYELAIEQFEKAQELEKSENGRDFPMAMWGAAMSTTWILWQHSDCKKGEKYLKSIPNNRPWLTDFEEAMVQTGYELYPPGMTDCTKEDTQTDREIRLMEAMQKVVNKFPEEVEPKLFFGAAKLATLAHDNCRGPDGRLTSKCMKEQSKARRVFADLYQDNPKHTGLIHYIIHAYDEPSVYEEANRKFVQEMKNPMHQEDHAAALGIKASNDYMELAKSSCHGLHMPSHIYIRLGAWNMSLNSNLLSIKVHNLNGKAFESIAGFTIFS